MTKLVHKATASDVWVKVTAYITEPIEPDDEGAPVESVIACRSGEQAQAIARVLSEATVEPHEATVRCILDLVEEFELRDPSGTTMRAWVLEQFAYAQRVAMMPPNERWGVWRSDEQWVLQRVTREPWVAKNEADAVREAVEMTRFAIVTSSHEGYLEAYTYEARRLSSTPSAPPARERVPRWWKCPRCSSAFFTAAPEGQWCAGPSDVSPGHGPTLVTTAVLARFVTTHDGWQGTYDNTIEAL